ncbi:MAG: MFS transporter [Chloroflexi bacterium]|nr:MFS transporter [Chloroflexota bacterium]
MADSIGNIEHDYAADADGESSVSVLRNRHFLLLWLAQAISQTAQNAIWFALMVVVEESTRSTTQLSLAVISTVLPGIALGMIAGVFVDRMNKKTVLVTTNLLRAVTVLGYLLYSQALGFIYVVNLVFCSISQFFGPAEAATIPRLVPNKQLITANSLFNLTFTGSQMAGIVLLAPWVLKLFGAPTLFVFSALAYGVSTLLVYLLPPGDETHKRLSQVRRSTLVDEMWTELKEGWNFIASDKRTFLAMRHLTLIASLMLVMSMIAPRFVVSVLEIQAEDSVYILAPAGIGVLVGATIMGKLANRFGKTALVNFGLVTLGISMFIMAILKFTEEQVAPWVAATIGFWPLPSSFGAVSAMMVLAVFLGFEAALVMVPSQTILMERAPVPARGRIFAVQMMLGNVVSILPLVFLGGLADIVGVNRVIALIGLGIVLLGGIAIRETRPMEREPVATGSSTPKVAEKG